MEAIFREWPPVLQALASSLFTWGVTALGAAVVFTAAPVSKRLLHMSLGFAAGVMIAASFWSLLAPSIALAKEMGMISWTRLGSTVARDRRRRPSQRVCVA